MSYKGNDCPKCTEKIMCPEHELEMIQEDLEFSMTWYIEAVNKLIKELKEKIKHLEEK